MSNTGRKKGKEHKPVLVESSAQLTKSRNLAEQNRLRHRLKGLEDQRRRSILAISEEERILMKDLENHRLGSHSQQASDGDSSNNNSNDHPVPYTATSRRNSYRICGIRPTNDSDIADTTNNIVNNNNNHNNNKLDHSSISNSLHSNDRNGRRDWEGRKHLWKHSKAEAQHASSEVAKEYTPSPNAFVHNSSVKKTTNQSRHGKHRGSKDYGCADVKFAIGNDNIDSAISLNAIVGGGNVESTQCDFMFRSSDIAVASSNRTIRPRRKTKEVGSIDSLIVKDSFSCSDINTPSSARPNTFNEFHTPSSARHNTFDEFQTSEDRRAPRASRFRHSLGNILSESLEWPSLEDLDKKSDRKLRGIARLSRKLSRSVNIDIDNSLTNTDDTTTRILTPKPTPGPTAVTPSDVTDSDRNVITDITSSHQKQSSTPLPSSHDKTGCVSQTRKTLDPFDKILDSNPFDLPAKPTLPRRSINSESHKTDICKSLSDINSSTIKTESKSPIDSVLKNGIARNRIVLSPIPSSRGGSEKGVVPNVTEKRNPQHQSKSRRKQKLDPLKHPPENNNNNNNNNNASADLSVPNVLKKCEVQCTSRRGSGPPKLDLPSRPVTSWSQRRRSHIFGEDPPVTPREVLNDTHAQWEELGDFLGQIRRQHQVEQAMMTSARPDSKYGHRPPHGDQSKQDFAALVKDRLLPRRHSESNVLLLSHAVKGKKDIKTGPHAHSRRGSFIPSDHPCTVPRHTSTNSTVKKLVTIHNVLQSSALSMADMDSETF